MPWTLHDKDATTLQNVGRHFRDTAVPHPTNLDVESTFLVSLRCYFFRR
jgi:hypothetical protein